MSVQSVLKSMEKIVEMAKISNGPVQVAIIDPGTNCAARYSTFEFKHGELVWEHFCQDYFAGDATGKNYVERMAMMARYFSKNEMFLGADIYLIEDQFKANVIITLGMLIGMIVTAREREMEEYVKRGSGVAAVKKMPYLILGLDTRMKTGIIRDHLPKSKKDIKTEAIEVAQLLCEKIGDTETLQMLTENAKKDDIADTVCYEAAFYKFIKS